MPNRDMKSNMQVVHLGNLTMSGTASAASAWVDVQGFDSCTLMVVNNTVTDAGTVVAGIGFEVQESDTTAAADATAVSDDELIGLEADLSVLTDGADDAIAGLIGYVGNSRYVRINATGSTATDADLSVVAIMHKMARTTDRGVGTAVAAT